MPEAEIRDRKTGIVLELFSWLQLLQKFNETHETETNPIFSILPTFLGSRPRFCIKKQAIQNDPKSSDLIHTANIFVVFFTVFSCVRISTVISQYGLHLIAAQNTVE